MSAPEATPLRPVKKAPAAQPAAKQTAPAQNGQRQRSGQPARAEQRTDRKGIGFDAVVESKAERRTGQLLKEVQPHDLLKFGIIPELVGRLPVITTLQSLDREQMIQILTEPKKRLGEAVSEAAGL